MGRGRPREGTTTSSVREVGGTTGTSGALVKIILEARGCGRWANGSYLGRFILRYGVAASNFLSFSASRAVRRATN